MSAGWRFQKAAVLIVLSGAVLCVNLPGQTAPANAPAASAKTPATQTHRKKPAARTPQKPPLQQLPSGPTGPVQQVPLDSMSPVAPQVSYQNQQLTINAPNSTLGDILRAIRKQTGAEIEVPSAPERVVIHLGPGPARDVIADLLNGSRFNYVLLGSPSDNNVLTRVVLVAKSAGDNPTPDQNAQPIAQQQPGGIRHTGNPGAPLPEPDQNSAESNDDAADDAAAQAEQPAPAPEPPAPTPGAEQQQQVKTPQQMLQEMQQRQMQYQQQQQQQGQPQPPPPQPPPTQPQ